MASRLDCLAVGDELAFRSGYGKGQLQILRIERVTKSGRLVCGEITCNPDLTVRGRGRGWSQMPRRGELVTDAIRREYQIQEAKSLIKSIQAKRLTDSQVLELAAAVKKVLDNDSTI